MDAAWLAAIAEGIIAVGAIGAAMQATGALRERVNILTQEVSSLRARVHDLSNEMVHAGRYVEDQREAKRDHEGLERRIEELWRGKG